MFAYPVRTVIHTLHVQNFSSSLHRATQTNPIWPNSVLLYYIQLDDDLPNYAEAEALRLDPARFMQDHWVKRHSVPYGFKLAQQQSQMLEEAVEEDEEATAVEEEEEEEDDDDSGSEQLQQQQEQLRQMSTESIVIR